MKLFNKLNPIAFFLAFCVGLFFCYITSPKPKIIYKYPNPPDSGLVTYIDDKTNCYQYNSEKITCPKDKSIIKDFPTQEII
jgi:hypothetical protein